MGRFPWVTIALLTAAFLVMGVPSGASAIEAVATDLSLTKTVSDDTPYEGDIVEFTVALANDGPEAATNVQVNHLLPEGMTFVSSQATRGVYVDRTGVWALGEIASRATETLTVSARVDEGTRGSRLVDTARIATFDQPDDNASNDAAQVEVRVRQGTNPDGMATAPGEDSLLRAGNADLGVVKTVDVASPAVGGTINYTVVLDNSGPDTATNIQVDDLLPAGVTYSSSSVTQGIYISGSGIWVLSSLANAASDTLTITATVDSGTAGTTITNTASIAALSETDSNSANDSDSADITVQGAELALSKTVSNSTPNEGESIDYTVSLTNNGPDAATNVQVTDLLPSGVTFVSSSTTQGSYVGGTGVWNVGTVANSATATLTITATVDAGTGTSTITNTASITATDQADANGSNNSDSSDITVQSVDLAVTKSVSDANPNEGDSVDYTIVLANNGPDAGTSVQITDVLPAGVTFSSSTATSGSYSSGTGVWSVASLAAAGSDTLVISATIDAGTGTSTITNTATLTGSDQADSNGANDSDSAALTVQSLDLAVTKSVDNAAPSEGGTINYTVVVANSGPDAASNVEITDVLPAGVTFASSSATAGSYVSGTGVWSLPSLAVAGADTLTITATVDAGTGGTSITNTASLTDSDQADSNAGNDSASAGISVQGADLSVTKVIDDSNPNEGDSVTYTVVVTNNGPDATTNATVSDVLPAGVTFVSSSATAGSYVIGTGVWTVPSLANAASETLSIIASVDAGTNGSTVTNTATATGSDQPDNNAANDSASAAFTVQAIDLVVTKIVSDTNPNEGDSLVYTVAVANSGPDDATTVQLTDLLPAGVTFVSSSTTQGTYVSGTGIWNVGNVANGAADTLLITATVDAGTNGATIVNTANLTASDQGDNNPANDADSATITVQGVDLGLTKVVSNTTPNEGGTVTYTLALTNGGPDAATNVEITDVLPAGVTFSSSTASLGSYSSGTGVWSIASFPNGAIETLNISATVDAGTNGSTILNTASVTGIDQADSNPANDSDSASMTVQSVDLVVTKTIDDPAPNEGDTINYTVLVANSGPDAATNVQVTDLLPAGMTFVSSSATQGFYVSASGSWILANIANGGSETLTITASVDAGTGGTLITNTASVTASDQADSNPANDSDSADADVQGIDLAVTKTVDDSTPNESDTVVYTIALTNNGPDAATSVVLTDVLPAGVTYVSSTTTQGIFVDFTGLWSIPSIASAASDTLTITATVDGGTGGSTIVNAAAVTAADQADSNALNDADSASIVVQSIDLSIVKTVDDSFPNEGDTINYSVVLANSGPDAATNVDVSDVLPAGVTFVSSAATTGSYSSGTGVWTVPSIAGATSETLTLTVTTNGGTGGSTILNTASVVASDQADTVPGNDSDSASLTVQGVNLSLAKTVDNPSPNEGGTVNYTIDLSNSGPHTATGIDVSDLLPAGVTFVSSSATQGAYVSGTGVWTVGSLTNGASASLDITATVDAGTNGSTILNTASVSAIDQADSNPGDNTDTATMTVQSVDLSVIKLIDDATPNEGDVVNYTVVVSNAGPNTATNVQLTDLLPAGVAFVSSSATQGTYVSGTGIWGVGSIGNGGAATLTITASIDAGTGGTSITNTASVTASDQADSNAGNDSASAGLTVQSVDLSVAKTVDDANPSEGGTINYSVVVSNAGPDAATTVSVSDVLPAGVTFVSSSATAGAYVPGTGIWSVPSVASAGSQTLTITATVDVATGGTTITNSAALVGADQADSNPANDSDSIDISVQAADLSITKSVDDANPNEGGTINYTIVVTNNGPDATTNVAVTDVLPAGVSFLFSSATLGTYSSGTGVWSLAALAGSSSETLTITAAVDAGTGTTTITNTASVTASDQPDNNPANDSASTDITVQGIDLALTKTVDDGTPNEGGVVIYTLEVANGGPDAATGVEVTDVLPAGVTFVAGSGSQGTYINGTGVWTVGAIASGSSATLNITATVDVGSGATTIVNSASITASDQADGNAANDSDTAGITVQMADLAITKTVDDATPDEGGTVVYSVVVANGGPSAATSLQITDLLPAGVTFVSSSATQGSYSSGTGIWDVGTVASAGSATLTITASVDAGTNGTTIVNIASVTSVDQADHNAANDSDTVDITVQSADLAISKTVDDATPTEGDTINYTITLSNLGPNTATNVQVTDLLPAGVTFVSSTATQGFYVDATGIWVVASLASPASETLTITATVDPATGGTSILNTASVTASDQADPFSANNTSGVSISVQAADLAVTKTVDDPLPSEGGTINYSIAVGNNGPDATTNVVVTDLLPAGVTFVSSSASAGSYTAGTGAWSLASLGNGATETLTITATVDAGTGGTNIINTAAVTASDQPDNSPGNDSDSAGISVAGSDLAIAKAVDNALPAEGGTIVYTIDLTNNGPDTATNMQINELLPAGVTFVSSSQTAGIYISSTGVWILSTVGNGATETLTITATVDAGTDGQTITNTASVAVLDQPDGNSANDSDSADIVVQGGSDLAVVKTVDDASPLTGSTINYTVVLSNAGPDPAASVEVTDLLPAGVTFVSSAATQGSYVDGTGVWSVASIAVAASDTLTITATVDGGTGGSTITNSATVTASSETDGNPANDSDSADITVQAAADLAVVKTVDDPAPFEGSTISYTIALTNVGPDAASNVEVTDLLPAGVTFVSSAATQGSYNSGTGVWDGLAALAATASDTLTITATVDMGTGGSTLTNTASITASDQLDGNGANDSNSADISVPGGSDLAVVKTVDDGSPSEGGTINYTIALTNIGPDAATNVEVTDLLPAGVTFVSSVATQGSYNDGTGIWSGVAGLAAAASDTLTITATVDAGGAGSTITNTASVTASDQPDDVPGNDSSSAGITVASADLAIAKTIDNPAPAEGATINYTIVLTNDGPDATTNIEVTDLLPTGATFVSSSATLGSYDDVTGVWDGIASLAASSSETLTITATVDVGTAGSIVTNTASVTASDEADGNAANDSDSASFLATTTGGETQITTDTGDKQPSWSPDGTVLTFASTRSGNQDVWTVPHTGGAATQVTVAVSTDQQPDWAPAGTDVVYVGPNGDLYIIPAGGGSPVLLSNDPANNTFPHYSPDGTTVTYASAGDIWTIPATGGTPFQVTTDPGGDAHPTWSPDGTQIAFHSNRGGNNDIWSIPAAGGTAVQITTHGGNDAAASWSPDGTTIAFQSSRSGNNDIWTIPATGGTAVQITTDVGNDAQPDWSPTGNRIAFARIGVGLFVYAVPTSGGPDLAVTKIVDDALPNEGGTINYTVVLTNAGATAATGIELTDVLPAGVTFTSSSATQGVYDSGTGVWTVGTVASTANENLTITASVDGGTGGQTITNTASVSFLNEADLNPANDSDSADITVVATADLAVVKTVDDPAPVEGGTINYTIALSNVGPDTATNVEVTDLLPAGVTFVSSSATQGAFNDGTGLWNGIASLAASGSDTLTITATVDAGTGGLTITNTADVTAADQSDGNAANDSDSADITVPGGADLAIVKTVDTAAPAEGATINYTVAVTNGGPAATTNVEVTDVLPVGVTFVSSAATQGTYSSGTGVWSGIASLATSASDTLTITATVDAGTGGSTVTNTATVTASDQADGNAANDSDSAAFVATSVGGEIQVTTVSTDARPSWSPSATELAFDSNRSGNRDVWTVATTGGAATQLTTLTNSDQHVDWAPNGTDIVYVGPNSDLYIVPAAGGAPVLLNADPASDRFPQYSADGTKVAYDSNGDIWVVDAMGGTPVQITTDPGNDLHPTWSSDGTQIAFISNRSGNNDIWVIPSTGGVASQITTDPGNDGAPDWSPDASQFAFQSNRSGNNDIWTIPAVGGVATQITTDLGNDAQPDWSPSGSRIAFARVGVGLFIYSFPTSGPDLAVTKTVDIGFPNEGDTINYTVSVTNGGSSSGTGVELTDILPAGVSYVSSSATQGTYVDSTGVWTVGSLASAASEDLTITATADAGTGGQTITNTAAVTAVDQTDGNPGNDTGAVDITVQSADLAVVKTVDDPAPIEGATVTYTVELTNNGPFTAMGVQVTDLLPAGVTFSSASVTQGLYVDSTGVWTLGNMVSSSVDTLTIVAAVDLGTNGQTITNTASVTASQQADAVPGNDSDSADITVGAGGVDAPGFGFVPSTYALGLGRPNPFRQGTTIPFDLPAPSMANVSIWDVTGRLVRTLVRGELEAGRYQPQWDGRDESGRMVSAGIYFVRLEAGEFAATRKVMRLR